MNNFLKLTFIIKLQLFETKKRIRLLLAVISLLLSAYIFLRPIERTSTIALIVSFIAPMPLYLYEFYRISKYYFNIEKESIYWKMLAMEEENKFELIGPIYEITENWKGIHFNNNKKQFSIMTDGLSKKQKNVIVEGLKNHSTLLS